MCSDLASRDLHRLELTGSLKSELDLPAVFSTRSARYLAAILCWLTSWDMGHGQAIALA
jgi:hypothetical protein